MLPGNILLKQNWLGYTANTRPLLHDHDQDPNHIIRNNPPEGTTMTSCTRSYLLSNPANYSSANTTKINCSRTKMCTCCSTRMLYLTAVPLPKTWPMTHIFQYQLLLLTFLHIIYSCNYKRQEKYTPNLTLPITPPITRSFIVRFYRGTFTDSDPTISLSKFYSRNIHQLLYASMKL